jgi:hypothetical protein
MVGGYGIPAVAIANSYISVANGYGKNAVASYCLIFCAIHPSYSNFLYIILKSQIIFLILHFKIIHI